MVAAAVSLTRAGFPSSLFKDPPAWLCRTGAAFGRMPTGIEAEGLFPMWFGMI